jgi:hypothetical protein
MLTVDEGAASAGLNMGLPTARYTANSETAL